jgi:hypothetical protein
MIGHLIGANSCQYFSLLIEVIGILQSYLPHRGVIKSQESLRQDMTINMKETTQLLCHGILVDETDPNLVLLIVEIWPIYM